MPPAISLRANDVTRVFPDGRAAFEHLDLAIEAGSFVALLGPSGCGKSTLLRLFAGFDRASAGTIERGGSGAPGETGVVFQDPCLLPWRSALDNAALPLELLGSVANERRRRARALLDAVGLADATDRRPAALSGGMRMRVSLARALVTEPRLLLLDEPFAAVDEITRQDLDDDLRRLWATRGMTVLFVTHAIAEAAYLADRVVVMSKGPARIVGDQRVELPKERTRAMRGGPAFAAACGRLLAALEAGS